MRRSYVVALALAIAIIVAATIFFVYPRGPSMTVSIEPENVGQLNVGDTFTVNVTVENGVNIYAVQGDIRFDPRILNVTQVLEGAFLGSAGNTAFMSTLGQTLNTTDPLSARVFFVESKTGTSLPDASGSGVLATITFQVISNGASKLQVFPYPGGNVGVGTYFRRRDNTEVIPALQEGSYGGPP